MKKSIGIRYQYDSLNFSGLPYYIDRCINFFQVHTIPPQMDYVLNHLAHCPKYDAAFENFLAESPEVQKIFTEYADKFLYWSKMSGENITTIKGAFDLHKTFYIETMHNKRFVTASFYADGIFTTSYFLNLDCRNGRKGNLRVKF